MDTFGQWIWILESLTLYEPRFFTEHANLTFRPAGTVIFSMRSVNSGSSESAVAKKREKRSNKFELNKFSKKKKIQNERIVKHNSDPDEWVKSYRCHFIDCLKVYCHSHS